MRVASILLALALGGCAMADGITGVWATGDGVRVNPETGRYIEDRPDIHPDYPTGAHRERNAVWDGGARRVALNAARNEFVSFQVIVEADSPTEGIEVRLHGLTGPNGARIDGKHVALFRAWYVHVQKPSNGYQETSLGPGWYPDALIPSAEPAVTTCAIPDPRNRIGPSQKNQTVWADIYVPRGRDEAPPGRYEGVVSVVGREQTEEIRVELNVWDFQLPDEVHCRGDIWNGSLRDMTPEEELKWYQMCHRHRFQPGVCYYRPAIEIDGTDVSLDWTEYDARVGRYVEASAFTDESGYWGPGYGVPIEHIILPFDCNKAGRTYGGWPMTMPEGGPTPEFERVWTETARQVKAHFDAHPILRTVGKVIFLGGLDESYNEAAYQKMIYYCKLLRAALGQDWFQYRIDGGYNWSAMEKLHPYIDLWVCHTAGFDHEKMDHFRGQGVETWFYGPMVYERRANSACGSNTFTDLDLLTCRGIGWVAWKYRSGFCQWEFDAIYDDQQILKRPTEPWDEAWTDPFNVRYGGQEFNGSGLLIYRGTLCDWPGPIPSIRLKAHRRGFQDYEYLWLLAQAGLEGEADRLTDGIVTTLPFGAENYENTNIWVHNPEAWDAARVRAGKLLSGARGVPKPVGAGRASPE